MKDCVKCTRNLPNEAFYVNRKMPDGRMTKCKDCTYTKTLQRKHQQMLERGSKTCKRCQRDKSFSNFREDPKGMLKLSALCRECLQERSDENLDPKSRARVYEWRWRQAAIKKGLCISCGKRPQDGTKRRCFDCAIKRSTSQKQKTRLWRERGLCVGCGKGRDVEGRKTCQNCYEKDRASKKRKGFRDKLKFIEMYGGCCKCCGEENPSFLTADHINRDGNVERKRGRGVKYKDLIRSFRKDIQILCFNCNCGRELHDGICPHKIVE